MERNRRVGRWVEYHDNGPKRAEGDYVWCEEPPNVEVTLLPPDGQKRSQQPGPPGCRVGTWTFWHDDGTLRGSVELDDRSAPAAPAMPIGAVHPKLTY